MDSSRQRFYEILLEEVEKLDEITLDYKDEVRSLMADIVNLEQANQKSTVFQIQKRINDMIDASGLALSKKDTQDEAT